MPRPDGEEIVAPLAPERIADLLAASATTVVAELLALGDEGGWRPEPGEWSANECVGHLIEAERRGFAGRIRIILAGPPGGMAALEGWDPPAVADARARPSAPGRGARRRVRRHPRRQHPPRPRPCARPTSSGPACIRMSVRCESMGFSANGSITTAITSARCLRSPRLASGVRWATTAGSASRTSDESGHQGGAVPRSVISRTPEGPEADDPADRPGRRCRSRAGQVAADEGRADRAGRVDRRAGQRSRWRNGSRRASAGSRARRSARSPLRGGQDDDQEDRREDDLEDQRADVA